MHAGKRSATFHRKLFPLAMENKEGGYQEREIISESEKQRQEENKVRQRLELPRRKGTHRRSRSDMLDSFCDINKWVEYEKKRAPMAEPESVCNLSILNLENQGKFITNRDIAALKTNNGMDDVCNVENGPVLRLPSDLDKQKKVDKKSSVGGFFSKLGRAVLKPRNVYSDGDQYPLQSNKPVKERKKSFSSDKENVNIEPVSAFEKGGIRDSKRLKSEGNSNKVSQFFKRGGLYRSSKMKKKNQNTAAV